MSARRQLPRLVITALLLAAALAAAVSSADAQLWRRAVERTQPTVAVLSGVADHRVDIGLGVERSSGPVFGVGVLLEPFAGVSLDVRGLGGTLDARTPPAETRVLGEVGAIGRLRVLSWLDATLACTARSYRSSLARQRWSSVAIGGEALVPIAGGVEATLGGSLVPIARISGQASPKLAVTGSTSVRWRGERLDLWLGYALERYDFPAAARIDRVEEHSSLVLRGGYRIGTPR